VPLLCGFYPGICLTTEEKARINLSQGTVYILPKHPHITKPPHTHTHTRARARTPPTHTHTHTHERTPPHTHTHAHIHTLVHTTHTHTHTHVKISSPRSVAEYFVLLFIWEDCLANRGTRWCSCLRQCTTSREIACSISDGVNGIFY